MAQAGKSPRLRNMAHPPVQRNGIVQHPVGQQATSLLLLIINTIPTFFLAGGFLKPSMP